MSGRLRAAGSDQRGITGLETAIVLIAFVVVASVFAFTILNSGLLATEQTRETIIGGLEEASGSLVVRGSMVAIATTTPPASVETVTFQMTTALTSDAAVDLSASSTIVTYVDSDQSQNLAFVIDPDNDAGWGTTWLVGSGSVLNQGERAEITVNLTGLVPRLAARQEFTIQVKPSQGGVLTLSRTTPAELTRVVDLR